MSKETEAAIVAQSMGDARGSSHLNREQIYSTAPGVLAIRRLMPYARTFGISDILSQSRRKTQKVVHFGASLGQKPRKEANFEGERVERMHH